MDARIISDWKGEIQRRRAVFLAQFLRAATIVGFVALIVFYLSLSLPGDLTFREQVSQMIWFIAAWLLVLVTWLWRGLGYRTRTWVVLVLTYALGVVTFIRGDLPGSGRVWLLLPPALALILLGIEQGMWSAGFSLLIYVVFGILYAQGLQPTDPLQDLEVGQQWVGEGASFALVGAVLVLLLASFSRGWLEALASANSTTEQLQMRTQELEETADQLQATAAVGQVCSSTLELDKLLTEVVSRIQREFERSGVYYVELYLLDQAGENGGGQSAALKAATGSVGQHFLEQGHRVALDRTTAVGRSLVYRRAVLAPSAEEGVVLLDTPLLDRTRSEIALPLNSRGRILGALSVQSTHEAAFDMAAVSVLQTIADQIAVSFDNAQLFAQTGDALREMEVAQRRYLTEAWQDFLGTEAVNRVDYVKPGVDVGSDDALNEARQAAVAHQRTVATDGLVLEAEDGSAAPGAVLAVPLKLRGQVVGTLAMHETQEHRSWTSEDMALAEAVAEQVALTVDNLRLMDETQRRAAQERLIGEVTARMRETLDLDEVLQRAVRSIGEALDIPEVEVRMRRGMTTGED